MRYSLQYKEW
jgi:hypothetical protein